MEKENSERPVEPNNIIQQKREILDDIGQLIREKIGGRVIIIDPKQIEDLFNIITKNDETILKHFSENELRQEIGAFLTSLHFDPPKSRSEFNDRIQKFIDIITIEKKYTAIIVITGVYDIPIGAKIGSLEVIEPDLSNKHIREYFDMIQKDFNYSLTDCVWGKIQFNSFKNETVRDVLFERLEFPFSILTFILKQKIDPSEISGAIFSEDGRIFFISPFKGMEWPRYYSKHEKFFDRLCEISNKENPSKLELKILRALDIFWLSQLTPKKEVEFLLLISTLESLLLTAQDRDYLGLKLAEKTAFLLECDENLRIKTYKSMKKMYSLRSGLIHSGKRKIDNDNLVRLKSYVYRTLLKIIELSSRYYKMESKSKDSDPDGIDDLILHLKFEGFLHNK